MKYRFNDIGGFVAKKDDRYVVKDNPFGNTLVLSSTHLFPGKETTGHKHVGQEEVYFFMHGVGKMQLDDEEIRVSKGAIVTIESGVFHKVINDSNDYLYFVCVFDGKRYDERGDK